MTVRATTLLILSLGTILTATASSGAHDDVKTNRPGRALPLPKGDDVFHFIIYGDRTGGPAEGIQVLEQAVRDTNLLDPDLVMTVGDLIQGYNQTAQWMAEMTEYRDVMAKLRMPWFPVAGNHDIYWRGPDRPEGEHERHYEKHFGPLWYWFEHKNAGFVILYSDEGDLQTGEKGYHKDNLNAFSDHQCEWLEASLKETRHLDHVFVFLHHPKWLSRYRGSNWPKVHEVLAGAGNVSAVFAGHIHRMHYEGPKDGIEYFALATTGGGIGREIPIAGSLHHMNVVTVRRDSFQVATLPVGEVLNPREMTQEHLTAIDQLLGSKPAFGSDPLLVDVEGAFEGEVTWTLSNPTSRPVDVSYSLSDVDDATRYHPDHGHFRLEPGGSHGERLTLSRSGNGFEEFSLPELTLNLDYLSEQSRYSLPVVEAALPFELGPLPQSLFEPIRGALSCDGRSCLELRSEQLDVPDGPLTLEAWIQGKDFRGRRGLIAKTENSEFGIFVSDGKPQFSIHLDGRYVTAGGETGDLEPERWYHIAGVFDGEEARLYIDGELRGRQAGKGTRTRNELPLFIGADTNRSGNPMSFFEGHIDEVRLSTAARYEGERQEPQRRFEPDEQTVLLLHLDRALGPLHPDHSMSKAHARETE